MKKIFVFLLLFCMPMMSLGLDDACTKPDEFTIDKRCYVTDDQKQQKPYNAVVGFLYQDGTKKLCTGTVVKKDVLNKKNKEEYFLYTAKHCSDLDLDNFSDNNLRIKLQDGREFNTELVKQGNYNLENAEGGFGDWVQYRVIIDADNSVIPYVKINDFFKKGTKNVEIIGYGRLKIMSDKEINDAKEQYANKIKIFSDIEKNEDGTIKRNENNGFMEDGGIKGTKVLMLFNSYFTRYFDSELKKSYCQYSSDGFTHGCQGWGGNSGGPIFDENGNIMGIVVTGNYAIGGKEHANITYGLKMGSFRNTTLKE